MPVSWAAYCALMGLGTAAARCSAQSRGKPRDGFRKDVFHLAQENIIRLQYCESFTTRALDWHAHASGGEKFGRVPRSDPEEPLSYDAKPMVAVSWQAAEQLASRLSDDSATYRLPTEAEWEAAARGGLAGQRYPWGDEPPDLQGCDFGRFDEFSIRPSRSLPPNGYGLYGMSGGVWEWTADWYDALYYAESPRVDPVGPEHGKQKVLRGGSWADCAETATVSFRSARESAPWWEEEWGRHVAPNIGFRLCRVEKPLLVCG